MVQREAKRKQKQKQAQNGHAGTKELAVLKPDAAGIDIGSRSHWVAIGADRDDKPVREFGTFTSSLHQLGAWLVSKGIKTVAMESTGVYWIPVFEILEALGLEVLLVNAAHLRNVPGRRKSDVLDCQWIQRLHSFGLLRGSVRPEEPIVELRAYVRQRARLIQDAARHVEHMQKALMEMNVQIHHVISDITGVTGMAIIRQIVEGERDGQKLAKLRDPRCKEPEEIIAAALAGNFKREHVFVLTQALALYDAHQLQLKDCDKRIEALLAELSTSSEAPIEPCPPPRVGRPRNNQPRFEIQSPLHRICGNVDLTQIPGVAPATALAVLSEVGTDISKWATEKHFTSWLNLAPGTKITGGKSLSARRPPGINRAGQALRQAAVSVGRTQTALGAFYRRLAARVQGTKAVVATARKIAVFIYRALRYGQAYVEAGLVAYERQQSDRLVRSMKKRAAALGFQLVPLEAEAAAVAT